MVNFLDYGENPFTVQKPFQGTQFGAFINQVDVSSRLMFYYWEKCFSLNKIPTGMTIWEGGCWDGNLEECTEEETLELEEILFAGDLF